MISKTFLTGCDENTEWQLPWFITNLRQHTDMTLLVANFGMSQDMLDSLNHLDEVYYFDLNSKAENWFKKPAAMLEASKMGYDKVCWLDTDCEVVCSAIETVFNWTEPNKLSMVEDRPWTARRGDLGIWHNSGVVVFEGSPNILRDWDRECTFRPIRGDQETLYAMIGGDEIKRMSIIRSIPNKYNTLRLDYIDNIASKRPCVIHHTGQKGKETIKRKMKNV